MADRNTNLAVDLRRYEARSERAQMRAASNIKPKRAAKASQTPAAIMLVVLIAAAGALIAMCISSKADIAAMHAEIVEAEQDVDALINENTRMKLELEQKSSQKTVEEYAENILGMQKLDKSQIEYISLTSGNMVEISEKDGNIFTRLKNAFDKFLEYLRG